MDEDSAAVARTRAALRCLYGAAGAHLHGDGSAMRLLIGQALPEVPLGDLLEAGVLSIAEQLRDVADARRLPAAALLRVLIGAHTEMAGAPDLYTLLLDAAAAYLGGGADLWGLEELCQLAACPTASVEAAATLLAATVAWRARDLDVDPARLVEHVCLGLAVREAGLLDARP